MPGASRDPADRGRPVAHPEALDSTVSFSDEIRTFSVRPFVTWKRIGRRDPTTGREPVELDIRREVERLAQRLQGVADPGTPVQEDRDAEHPGDAAAVRYVIDG